MVLLASFVRVPFRGATVSTRRRFRLSLSRCCLSNDTSSSSSSSPPRAMDMAFAPVNDFHMNQYAIACTQTKQAALIDCGAASTEQLDVFLHWLQEHAYQLTAVWQTHAHLDHVAGLGLLRARKEYADIPIHLHAKERNIYNSFDERRKDFGLQVEGDGKLPPDTDLTFFDDTQTAIQLGNLTFYIIPTPGHSPGHVGFFEPSSKSFFGGDFIMQASIGRTDFPTSSPEDMNKSLEKFVHDMDEEIVIFPGHGPATTLKQEKQVNPFLQAYSNNWGGA